MDWLRQKTTIMGIGGIIYALAGVATGHLDWAGAGAVISGSLPLLGISELPR